MKDKQQAEMMTGESLDISEQRRRELKQLFPGVFTETAGADGQPVESIDFERLKAELGNISDIYEGRRERYGMEWPGKRDCMKLIQEPSRATLKPCREESVDFDTTQNLFIEGDNLEVLKLLQKSYYGKVKMIYIDPPYNTGKEFIYPDNYKESLETYMAYAGLVDDKGKKFSTNTTAEGRFHTKWLNMMYPRLYLARNLLREDGVIFISIDDNEVENLRRMCDEIFGEENFVTTISWFKKTSPSNDAKWFSSDHEHILLYSRTKESWRPKKLPLNEKQKSNYSNPDNDPRGDWNSATYTCNKTKDERPNLYYSIENTHTGEHVWPKETAVWKYGKELTGKYLKENKLYWGKDGNASFPRFKKFLYESDGVVPRSVWRYEDVGHTQMATEVFQAIIPEVKFDTPKPPKLLKQMLRLSCPDNEESVVLDFFAGSGTLGQAVYELVSEVANTINFVLVQLPEKIKNDTFATISDVSKERIRRSAQKILQEQEGQLDLEGKANQDLGFKVFKLDQSNFKQWQTPSAELTPDQLTQQLELHTDHIDPYATQEEILYELLLKAGFKITDKIETLDLAGGQLFSIAEGALLICLEEELTSELIDAVADQEPMQFICLDKGFKGNDQLKANAVQTFKSRSQGAETEMVFKVV